MFTAVTSLWCKGWWLERNEFSIHSTLPYECPKLVWIRDFRLGVIYVVALLAILCWTVLEMCGHQKWLSFSQPRFTVRTSLQDPTKDNCDSISDHCQVRIPAPIDLEYCCVEGCEKDNYIVHGACMCKGLTTKSYQCKAADSTEASEVFEHSIFIMSRKTVYNQKFNESCRDSKVRCAKRWVTEDTSESYYVSHIEGFHLSISHSIFDEEMGTYLSAQQMEGFLRVAAGTPRQRQLCQSHKDAVTKPWHGVPTDDSPCYIPSPTRGNVDVFEVGMLLNAMGVDLDVGANMASWQSMRATGFPVVMEVEYFNSLPWVGRIGEVRYVYRLEPMTAQPYTRAVVKEDTAGLSEEQPLLAREVIKGHGILISFVGSGRLGVTCWANLVEAAGMILALVTLTEFVMRKVVMRLLNGREFYYAYMNQISADFKHLPELEKVDALQITEALHRRNLKTEGSEKERILRLLDAGWHPHQKVPMLDEEHGEARALARRPPQDKESKKPVPKPIARKELADKVADEIMHSHRGTRELQESFVGTLVEKAPFRADGQPMANKIHIPTLDLAPMDFGQASTGVGADDLGPRVSQTLRKMPNEPAGPKAAGKPKAKPKPFGSNLAAPTTKSSSREPSASPRNSPRQSQAGHAKAGVTPPKSPSAFGHAKTSGAAPKAVQTKAAGPAAVRNVVKAAGAMKRAATAPNNSAPSSGSARARGTLPSRPKSSESAANAPPKAKSNDSAGNAPPKAKAKTGKAKPVARSSAKQPTYPAAADSSDDEEHEIKPAPLPKLDVFE